MREGVLVRLPDREKSRNSSSDWGDEGLVQVLLLWRWMFFVTVYVSVCAFGGGRGEGGV